MTDIVMPSLSDSMEHGTIISWFKANGDQVEIGEELCEIETDKATVAFAAELPGTIELLAPIGATVAVGQPIARIDAAQSADPSNSAPVSGTAGSEATDETAQSPVAVGALTPSNSAVTAQDADSNGIRATPLARRVAAVEGVDLDAVDGTGPLGRVTRADVLRAAGVAIPAAPKPPEAQTQVTAELATPAAQTARGSSHRELSRLQQRIARRMSESKATVPHFQVQTEVNLDAAIALRSELKAMADETQIVPSINDVIIKAAALALANHPLANGSYREGAFVLHDAVNVGVAVAAEEALVVPTVFEADIKSLGQIARETRHLAARVRDNTISPADLSGGTFTVSNLGMFGMTAITPVINPPQAAILGVGAARPVLARIDGEIVEREIATLTLSCDHRILYGADAARFLAEIRALLEAPLRIAL